jgi:hypothetical protein
MALPNDDDALMHEVWDELRSTRDPSSREVLLVRLAEFALDLHDFSDLEVHEEIHDAFATMRAAQEQYQLAALRVGRLVVSMLEADDQYATNLCNENTAN